LTNDETVTGSKQFFIFVTFERYVTTPAVILSQFQYQPTIPHSPHPYPGTTPILLQATYPNMSAADKATITAAAALHKTAPNPHTREFVPSVGHVSTKSAEEPEIEFLQEKATFRATKITVSQTHPNIYCSL
jgi:hypothetical protein